MCSNFRRRIRPCIIFANCFKYISIRQFQTQLHLKPTLYLFIKRELLTTETELNAIAAPAMTGLRRNPVNGYKIPAAIGIPSEL